MMARVSVNGPIHETGRLMSRSLFLSLTARYLTLLFSNVLNFFVCAGAADEEMLPQGHVYRTYLQYPWNGSNRFRLLKCL